MEILEKKDILNELFSEYQQLLTDKQQEYFKLYYFEDYSLQEIAEISKVSKNAIFDQLKHVEANLYMYEEKLRLVYKHKRRNELLDELKESKDFNKIDEIRKLDE